MVPKKRSKLKLTKESLKRLGARQLTLAKGGTDTADDNCDTYDMLCDFYTVFDSVEPTQCI